MISPNRHRVLMAVFSFWFSVYAVSPLFFHLGEDEDTLEEICAVDINLIKKIFVVDFIIKSFQSDDVEDSDRTDNTYVMVKKRRVVLKKLDDVAPPASDAASYGISEDEVYACPCFFSSRIEQTGTEEFRGFRPLFSGLSPPVA